MSDPRIDIAPDGPYLVHGGVPVREKDYVYSEHGEPMTWKAGPPLDPSAAANDEGTYRLCRCGQTDNAPFCDNSHADADFDGTETAPTDSHLDRATARQGEGLEVLDDVGLCMHAGQCGNRETNVWKMVRKTEESITRIGVIRMVEKCPSGRLVNRIDGEIVEPSLPQEIGVVPGGPLWVTGGVPVQRADGEPFETRNRVTLCRCGASGNKPLCDGTHKEIAFEGIT